MTIIDLIQEPTLRPLAKCNDATASDEVRAALHEAAHAVVGRALKLPCGGAGFRTGGTRVGFAEIDPPWLGWRREHGSKSRLSEAYIVTAFAGAEAERQAFGASNGGEWQDAIDAQTAMNYVRVKGCIYVGDDAWQLHAERLRKRSSRLVARHWRVISAVAEQMLRDRVLSAGALDGLCEGLAAH